MAGVQKEGCTLDEDDIDRLKLPKVLQLCKENEIDLTRKPKLDEIKLELKLKLLCKDSSRQEVIYSLFVHIFSVLPGTINYLILSLLTILLSTPFDLKLRINLTVFIS